jgi:hypothetical protein
MEKLIHAADTSYVRFAPALDWHDIYQSVFLLHKGCEVPVM